MLAMYHDYRVMNPHRGWLCLNELEFDAELAPGMAPIFKSKVSNSTLRALLLEAKRFTSLQALEAGLVDGLGGLEEALKIMTDVDGGHGRGAVVVGTRGKKTVYGRLKEDIYKEVLAQLDVTEQQETQLLEERYSRRDTREEEELLTLQKIESSSKARL